MGGAVLSAAMIAWAQSQIEGIPADKYNSVAEGLTWRWNGEALSLAGRSGALLLTGAMAAKPQAPHTSTPPQLMLSSPEYGSSFVVTDGERAYSGLPVTPGGVDAPLLVFHDGLPPSRTDLKIIQAEPALLRVPTEPDPAALLCFTPGTEIATPEGPVKIEDLGPGDRVMTRDSGPQEVIWIGHRRMTGARLFALPGERPIRIRAGALNGAAPREDVLVSPDHRVLRRDVGARALWGEHEVLVRAADLVGQPGVGRDHCLTETFYVNLMLPNHEVIWANGLEVESFHPGFAGFASMTDEAKQSLIDVRSDLAADPHRFGPSARRQLSQAEAEILRYKGKH
ncbi:MAG: Hint domain-containing protein [Pseudomonadota bacterium]